MSPSQSTNYIQAGGLALKQAMTNGNDVRAEARTNGSYLNFDASNDKGLTGRESLTNGNGLSDGACHDQGFLGLGKGSSLNEKRDHGRAVSRPKRKKGLLRSQLRKNVLSSIFFATLFLAPLSLYLIDPGSPSEGLFIDGDFSDWDDASRLEDPSGDISAPPRLDIVSCSVDLQGSTMTGYMETYDDIFKTGSQDHVLIFIDADGNVNSGYHIQGLGAEHMVDIKGSHGRVNYASYKTFQSDREPLDWNGFTEVTTTMAKNCDHRLEFRVHLSEEPSSDLEVLFIIQDRSGHMDTLESPWSMKEGILFVEQQGISPSFIATGSESMGMLSLDLHLKDNDATISAITLEKLGTAQWWDLGEIFVALDDGDGVFTKEDRELGIGQIGDSRVTIDMGTGLNMESDTNQRLWIGADTTGIGAGSSLGFRIREPSDIRVSSASVVLSDPVNDIGVTIGENTQPTITIDGLFHDWNMIQGEVNVEGSENPNIDISETKGILFGNDLSLYFRVDGTVMAGTIAPIIERSSLTNDASDEATEQEDRLHAIPSHETVDLPPLVGYDMCHIYIDCDLDKDTGYPIEDMAAEYRLSCQGTDNRIHGTVLEIFNRGQWRQVGNSPLAACDLDRLEVMVSSLPLSSMGYSVLIVTADWWGVSDLSSIVKDLASSKASEPSIGSNGGSWYSSIGKSGIGSRSTDGPVSVMSFGDDMKCITNGTGSTSGDMFGWNVSNAGDVNDDGYDDMIVGAPFNDSADGSRLDAGAAYIFFGHPSIDMNGINATSANITIYGSQIGGRLGWDVSDAGDTDGDGVDDIIIGEPYNGSGRAYIFHGSSTWTSVDSTSHANVNLSGENSEDRFGHSVSTAGDFNDDGFDDVVVGAYRYSSEMGKAYVFYGSDEGVHGDTYDVVSEYTETYGTMADFSNMQSYIDGGAYATISEGIGLSPHPTPAMIAYAEGSGTTPRYRLWDGEQWGPEHSALDVGGDIQYVVVRACPIRNEYIMGTLGSDGDINIQVFNGTAWSHLKEVTNTIAGENIYRGFDIAYEQTSGDAIVVFANNTNDPEYCTWNGNGWSDSNVIDIETTNKMTWICLEAKPRKFSSDEMILLTLDKNKDTYGIVWNGSGWGNGMTMEVDGEETQQSMDVAYESVSGRAMAAWTEFADDNVEFRFWNGTQWSDETGTELIGANPKWAKLASDPTSNRILIGVLDNEIDVNVLFWNGTAVQPKLELEDDAETNVYRCFDVAFEESGEQALVVWADKDDLNARYAYWDKTGDTWTGGGLTGLAGPQVGDDLQVAALCSDPYSDDIFLSTNDLVEDIRATKWSGSSFGTTDILEDATLDAKYEPYMIAYRQYMDSYQLNITGNVTSIPSGTDVYKLEIRANTSGELFNISIFDGSGWNVCGDMTSTTMSLFSYYLTSDEVIGGQVSVRFTDDITFEDEGMDSLCIDYLRVKGLNAGDKNYTGEGAGDWFGFVVSDAGDVNNDSYDEVIVGAPMAGGTGKAYIIYNDAYSYATSYDVINGSLVNFTYAQSDSDLGANATLSEQEFSGVPESGSVYLAIVQPSDRKGQEAWWEWNVVNPTDTPKTCTEVRVKRTDDTDMDWTIAVQGNPGSGWVDGGTYGLYWSGSQVIQPHSALNFRVRAKQNLDVTDAGLTWTATVTGETVQDVLTLESSKGGPGGTPSGDLLYNLLDDTTEQTEAGTYPNGLNAYLTEDVSSQDITPGTEYTFYLNIHDYQDSALDAGGALNVMIPREFSNVTLVDNTDFSDAVVSGGGASNWSIDATNDAQLSNDVQHISFKATTPSGYCTNKTWELDTRLTGTGGGRTVRFITEAIILVQADTDEYTMDIELNMSDVREDGHLFLQLNYSVDGTGTEYGIKVYNTTSDFWDDLGSQGYLTSTTPTSMEFSLDPAHRTSSGTVLLRIVDLYDGSDVTNSSLYIDYLRVKSQGFILTLIGENPGDQFGWSVSSVGDIDQDGSYDDVIVGAPGYSGATGRAYIYQGGCLMDTVADNGFTGEGANDRFGYSVSGGGDVDGDGIPDVIVGAPFYDNGSSMDIGAIYVYKGGSSMDNIDDWFATGETAGEHFGRSVSGDGDINDDNISDILVGSPHFNDTVVVPYNYDAGRTYIFSTIPEFEKLVTLIMIVVGFTFITISRRRKKVKKNSD